VSDVAVRPARPGDAAALARIDHATWTALSSPAPRPPEPPPFFGPRTAVGDVLVAEVAGGRVAGYVKLGHLPPLAANRHVAQISGLAVDPELQGRGVGRALLAAAADEARSRGARKLTLRVLGENAPARALYRAFGFAEEGVLREEFLLGGRYVDDVLMALSLVPAKSG
jgi:ribosomal protein S18 acetylase RimI-like enzyme